jgi:hypothetical protein
MKTATKVYLKLSISMLAILAFVLSLLLMMTYMKYQNILSSLVSSRLSVVAANIENSVNKTEQLGVSLQDMVSLRILLDRAVLQDGDLKSVAISSAGGRVLFSSELAEEGSMMDSEWLKTSKASPTKTFYKSSDDELTVGLRMINQLGVYSGTVILRYDNSSIDALLAGTWRSLFSNTLWLFAIFSLVGLVVGRVGFSELINFYQFLNFIEHRNELEEPSITPWMQDIEQKITAANDQYIQLDQQIATIAQGIESPEKGGSENG